MKDFKLTEKERMLVYYALDRVIRDIKQFQEKYPPGCNLRELDEVSDLRNKFRVAQNTLKED